MSNNACLKRDRPPTLANVEARTCIAVRREPGVTRGSRKNQVGPLGLLLVLVGRGRGRRVLRAHRGDELGVLFAGPLVLEGSTALFQTVHDFLLVSNVAKRSRS